MRKIGIVRYKQTTTDKLENSFSHPFFLALFANETQFGMLNQRNIIVEYAEFQCEKDKK